MRTRSTTSAIGMEPIRKLYFRTKNKHWFLLTIVCNSILCFSQVANGFAENQGEMTLHLLFHQLIYQKHFGEFPCQKVLRFMTSSLLLFFFTLLNLKHLHIWFDSRHLLTSTLNLCLPDYFAVWNELFFSSSCNAVSVSFIFIILHKSAFV